MPYREELEAALARTAAVEDELAVARSENAHDHERIAELEKQLAEARADVTVAKSLPQHDPPSPPPPPRTAPPAFGRPAWWTPWILLPVGIMLVIAADEVVKHANKGKRKVTRPAQIDVMTELSRAKVDARKLMPDAALLQMETQTIGMVDARGFADLGKGFVTFDFFSPSQRRYVHVLFMQGGERQVIQLDSLGGLPIHDPPRCSVVDVWAEAIRRGASPSSLAEIHLGNTRDGPAWTFQVGAGSQAFAMTLPDECASTR